MQEKVDFDSHDLPVGVTVDGSDVMWQVTPCAFMFVAQEELEKLQDTF